MREIKFRAWHKPTQLMDDVVLIDIYNEKIGILYADPVMQCESIQKYNFNEVELMQYTCLKDKNGQEIYEGDILGRQFYVNAIVSYDDGAFEQGWNCHRKHRLDQDFCSSREVIGNIFEDEELLND